MRHFIAVCFIICTAPVSANAFADDMIPIEMGRNYHDYSPSDLQRRVWDLERAVWQLQQKVIQLESTSAKPAPTPGATWICTITAAGNIYTGTGNSKPEAMGKVVDACKAGNQGDGFFCKSSKCEQ